MAFFHQLRLLIWKNGLGIIRQPGWSLTLVLWPVIIFLILAITRHRFPPVMKDACYTGPKNLPSTGFFPFLQTLMCNTDSSCHNKSRQVTHRGDMSRNTGQSLQGPPMAKIVEGASGFHQAWTQETRWTKRAMLDLWEDIIISVKQPRPSNKALMDAFNNTQASPLATGAMLESMNMAKRLLCTWGLSAVNTSSPGPLSYGVVTFCQSNDTLLEVSLLTINKMLMGVMLSGPGDALTAAGQVLMTFNQMQNDTSLFDSLFAIPRLLASESLDQALVDTQTLLVNLQSALRMVQKTYPDMAASVSMVHPLLAGGINTIQYMEKWPGRDVYITLGDVVTLQNNSLASDAVQLVLQRVTIPLDKAMGLTMDRPMLRAHICNGSSASSLWLSAACMTGTVDMLLDWISPDKVAEQILLVWSRDVAAHDVTFVKGLLHSLAGMSGTAEGSGGSSPPTRAQRSVDVQPQNIYEELFLTVGHVVLDIAKSVPEVDAVLQSLLTSCFTSLQTAALTVDTVEEMMDDVLIDAGQLQENFLMLMTNQTHSSALFGHIMDSVIEIIMKGVTAQGPVPCESLLAPLEWLLAHQTVDASFWRALLCQNGSSVEQVLQMGWTPLIQKVQQTYAAIVSQADYNVTLPMILSEWQKLFNGSVQLGALLDRLSGELGEGYWTRWVSWNITYDVPGTLMESAMWAVVRFGESLESSPMWPQVKTYMHMANWIVNYKPNVTTEPANCSLDINTFSVDCDTGLNWPQFVHATSQAVMTLPNKPEILISCLQGTVSLLQHVYGGALKHQAASLFKQEIPGGDALSAYLSDMLSNLDKFFQTMTRLNNSHLSDAEVLLPLVHNLLQSAGLSPLMPLLYADGPVNVSTLLAAAVKLGRQNQYVFAFNETDPTMPDLERMLMQLLSMEGNLTLPLSLGMGHTLLTYSNSLSPEGLARLREALRPFTNQTSTGLAEAILTAVELLKRAVDAPDGDPTHIILGCLRQLQEFLASALRLRRIDQFYLPSGQLSTGQVTDLSLVAMDILKLVTPEGLQNLTVAGPDAAQKVVLGKILALLPLEAQAQAQGFIADLQTVSLIDCNLAVTSGVNCAASFSEFITLLQQIVELMAEGKGSVTINLAPANPFLRNQESMQMTVTLFSLLLPPGDVAYVKTFNQTLHFIKLVLAKPNVTVADVQNALRQSNLSLVELNGIAALAGAANINDLMVNILGIVKARQCFEPQGTTAVTTQCVVGLVNGLTGFLTNVPYLRNQTAILSLIPLIVNKTISEVTYTDFSSDPHMATVQILNSALTNIEMNLQLLNLSSPEIANEIRVVEGLLKLAANTGPFNALNSTLLENPQYAQLVYLEIAQWYLERLQNATSTSSFHSLLGPLYRFTEMQVALQLAQSNFSLFVSNEVEQLMQDLRYPVDGTGLSAIGQTVIEILQCLMELIKLNLEVQSGYFQGMDQEPVLNTTVLYSVENQITWQLNLIRVWMKHPSVTSVFSSMLLWGGNSTNPPSPGTDIHQLLQTMSLFLSSEQQTYLSLIENATQALNNVVMVAQQPGGLQSAQFSGAISEVVQIAMHGLTAVTGPLPLSVREAVQSAIQDSLHLVSSGNFRSDPHMATMQVLYGALTNIKTSLQLMNLSSSEIRNEIRMVEGLLNLAANTEPLNALNSTLMENPLYAQVVYLEIAQWYLKQLENATSTSSLNRFLNLFYRFTEMQLAVQLAQANLTFVVSYKVEHLAKNLRHPIDGTGLSAIGQTVIEILQHQIKFQRLNLESQNDFFEHIDQEPMFNTTALYSVENQITQQLNLIRDWMKHPNVTSVFSSMLQWGSNSTDSSPGTDIHQLLQTMSPFFSSEIIDNVTQALIKALAVAQQPGGLQSAQFSDAVLEAVQIAMHGLTTVTGPLPASVQETILKAVQDSLHLASYANFSSDPHMATVQLLNSVLANIKMNLQLMNLSSPEIMNEVRMVEGLLKLVANTGPLNALSSSTLLENPEYAQVVYLEIAQWYLKELENATSTSSLNRFLYPFYRFTDMQVAVQILYANFSLFISDKVQQLTVNLHYPIDGTGMSAIGQTVIEILLQQMELFKFNLEFQNDFYQSLGLGLLVNTTVLYPVENQITWQLNLIHDWMKHPSVTAVFSSMLQWGSSSSNSSSPGTDIHQLLQTLSPFLSSEQQTYLSLIDNATLALTNVFMVAQRPGGLQSAQFSGAISEVVRNAMHGLTAVTGPLPLSLRETIQGVVQDLLSSISDGDLSALSNITISVHLMNLTTFEIMNEIRVVEALLNLATNTGPLNVLNSTLLENPQYAQVVYLEIAQWYLEKVEKVASTSSFSSLLDPLFRFTEMQVAVQLAQANFSLFVSNQVEQLMQDLRYPVDGTGMSQIGQTVIEILQRQMELITFNLERQNDYFQGLGQGPLCNSTTLYAVEYEITQQMNLIRVWMKHPNVTSVFSSMLQWGSNSTNPPSPATDIHQLLQTMSPFFSSEQLTYLSLIDNVTQALNAAVMVAQRPGGLQSAQFLEAVQAAMHSLTPLTGSLPASVSENILSVLQGSLHLILDPEMAYASARNISMHLLESTEHLVRQIVPEMLADYLLPGIQITETYFRTISTSSGTNIMNEIILNEMETIKSVLPSNMTQAYISLIINITKFILEPSQGNMNIWTSFETGNLSVIISQMGELLNTVLPFLTGDHGINITIPSLEAFTQLGPVLEQILMEEASQETWEKLKKMLEAVLSNFKGTELWDDIPPAMSLVEVVLGVEIKQMMAETAFIWSLQGPVLNLMEEAVLSVNTSRSNLSAVIERMEKAITGTMHATQQANGTALLRCSQVLGLWEPVREAAGLSEDFLTAWCNVSLQPVIHAYAHSDAVYNNLHSVTQRPGTATVPAMAASLVEALRALYQADLKQGTALEGLIMAFCSKLEQLAARPVSAEAERHWLKQFQEAQLIQSLELTGYLTEEVGRSSPALRVYVEAGNKALTHVLQNVQHMQNASAAQNLLLEAGHVLLTSLNISSDSVLPLLWGNASGVDGATLGDLVKQVVALVIRTQALGDVPKIYQAMAQLVASNGTALAVEQMYEVLAWWSSTQAAGMDFVTQAVSRVFGLLRAFLPVLTDVGTAVGAAVDLTVDAEMFEVLIESVVDTISQMGITGDLLAPIEQFLEDLEELLQQQQQQQQQQANSHAGSRRRRREAPVQPTREPMDDFIDLFFIDYRGLFEAISVPPTVPEMVETAHVFFSNADLGVVMKGATKDLPWALNSSKEDTIDAALGVLSYLTLPHNVQTLSMDLLMEAVNVIPDGLPLAGLIKNVTGGFAGESQENLMFMQQTLLTAWELLGVSPMDQRFTEILGRLTSQVCAVEQMSSVQGLWQAVSMETGLMCKTVLPSLQFLAQGLQMNASELSESLFQIFIGNPSDYDIHSDWATVFSESFGLNASSLQALNINVTSSGGVTVGEVLRNKSAFMLDVQQNMEFDPRALSALMETPLPNSNLAILSWLVNLRLCNDDSSSLNLSQAEQMVFQGFCSLSVHQWYTFSLLLARHINTEKLIYRLVLSQDMQNLVGVVLQMASFLTDLLSKLEPAIGRLDGYIRSLGDLNVMAGHDFKRVERSADPSKPASRTATFTTLSRALCSKGILAVFGISKLTIMSETNSSLPQSQAKEEMIKQFKIPRDASPFCMSLYLDMVNTTGGAIAWAFLKPMLMGHILYTPDTPLTRAIMEKSNNTLQEFANLRSYSEDWIESSGYISKSARLLTDTLPMLQNSLGNSFVENFIQMQTNINVGSMKDTLSNFSNMTLMLEKNQEILKQITTLSNLMVNISSCIKFDRYRGFDSAEELNAVAQDLAKDRNLYGSVIFKLPKDEEGSSKNDARSSSASSTSSTLPPRVRYTIRMHMDNLMRTDRVRNPYFVRDHHISAAMTLRYNRGFVYLQESIDRAIIETQAGRRVTEPAVQLQPFPYPCFIRDEYLEAISFVFPLMLMIAWVLFVADFVKKLVHEREMRLHEYMKMMGVNPLSHFFAWFLECAAYLVFTIFILTLVLKYGRILPQSDGFLLFLYFCDYGLSIVAISYLVSAFFDKTYIAGLSGSLVYVLCFFPFIVMMALESKLSFSGKSALGLFAPTCFSYASQYVSRYESQGEGIQWSNSYVSPMAGDTASFGWLCWLMLIDSLLYFIMGGYIRMVFPGKYGIPAPWYFPFKTSFWAELCCSRGPVPAAKGMLFTNIMQKKDLPVFHDGDKGKGEKTFSPLEDEETSGLPVGVALHGLTKMYGERPAIQNLNLSFYEGQVTSLLGHNGAGKTTTMSLLTGLFAPSSGTIEVYGRDMQANIEDVRKELGVCMQYDVHFDHMTAKEHLMLYGQIKAPYWSRRELDEQVCKILQETGMYAHRHKRVGTLSGGMKRKLSISIAFIGGSRLVVLDEPTTGVDPCSRRSIWDIVIQHKKERTIIMSTHHLDEAEVLSDRIAFLERGGLKVCGTPLHLKDKLGQGYNLTVTKKVQSAESEARFDSSELKEFIQAHVPEARLKEAHGGDLVYSLPPFTSSNASAYRSLLTALDANLDALQLGCYGISDTTLEEVFLQLTQDNPQTEDEDRPPLSVSESISDFGSTETLPEDLVGSGDYFNDKTSLTGSSTVKGLALAWQQVSAMLVKRFHHSRRDWKGLISQIVLPVLFVVFAMGLGSIRNDLQHYPELELSPALYNLGPSYSFFSNQNPSSSGLVDSMMSFPGIDNACLDEPDSKLCSATRNTHAWKASGNSSQPFSICRCTQQEQVCNTNNYQPPSKKIASSQSVYNLTSYDVENYLVSTANDFIRNRYGGFAFGKPLPPGLQMDLMEVPKNRTVSKVWYNPEGHHTMPAYLNSLNNFILRSNLPADKDPRKYAISVSSHPYYGRADDEDAVVQGMIQILVALCVLTGYSIMTASFAIYEVHEHHSGSKRLQHISGISEPLYWAVNFFYDMVLYMVPVALTVAVVAIFQVPAFTEKHNLGAVTLLLVLFGFATFPWMYLLSGIFKDAEMAFITYVCINLFVSVNTIMTTSILFFMGQLTYHNEAIQKIFTSLSNAFLIFPQFSFGNGLMEMARTNMEVQLLSGYGIDAYKDPFSTDTLGWMFISSIIQGLVFFTLRLLINKGLIRTVRHLVLGRKVVPQANNVDDDEDVVAERERMASGAAHTDLLQVNQLTKIYQHLSRKVHAVKRLSVGIPAGECFGLLGVNGAGKTTTFKMLTGDVSPTDGTAQIKDWDGRMVDIMECRNQGINIGYCPQVDALDDLLTGEEHLYFYARVRGIATGEIHSVVNYLLKKLELDYHRNTITDGYSCGTRRKLSTALALIGHPQILLLDEPSSGMDPRTKRHLWKIISEEVKGKCAVVLTSHSMEECEALCSRLAIMVKGQFRCLGSLQHIKNRFGSGFTVKMYLARASCDVEAITSFMQQRFPSTYLKDQHSAMVEYHVPVAPGGVADIFDQLESSKTTLQIKHFSISQTTLDEVFINFAMGKVGMETVPLNSSEDSDSLFSIESIDT